MEGLWKMLKFEGGGFYKAVSTLHRIRDMAKKGDPKRTAISDKDKARIGSALDELRTHLQTLVADLPIDAADRLKERMARSGVTYGQYETAMHDIESRVGDHLRRTTLLALNSKQAEQFEPANPLFGAEVASKFACCAYEIEEAAKCLALDRSTASAFHSIRCLEAGIRGLSRCLGIPDPTRAHQRSWMKLLDALKAAIHQKWPTNSNRMSGDGEFFDNAYAGLAAMQNPWRNATMHLDQKYTLEEAYHIFETVRGFMMQVARRMDENGQPLA